MIETWRKIDEFDGYEVSDFGRVRSFYRGGKERILKPWTDVGDYLCVGLHRGGKRFVSKIHHLVLEAFVGSRPQGLHAAHLDGKRSNNVPMNLKWVTRLENEHHKDIHGTKAQGSRHGMAKLSESDIPKILGLRSLGLYYHDIAMKFGVHKGTIQRICTGADWSWLTGIGK